MAPQVIQIGSGKKQGGSGLFYAMGALSTAFAVDYWLSTNKMEEELAKEGSDSQMSEKKANKALEEVQKEAQEESEESKPAPIFEKPKVCREEISRFSSVDDFSEGELDDFVGDTDAYSQGDLSVTNDEVSIPKDEISVYRQDEISLRRQDETMSRSYETMSRSYKRFEPIEEEPEDIKILSEDEDVDAPLETEAETSIYPEFGVALWKVILITILALLWAYAPLAPRRFPRQNEEFESTEMPESIPMLGSTDDATTTAVAVAVDALSAKGETSSNNGKPTISNELTFAYRDPEEKWGIVAVIALVMMIL